MIIRLYKKRYLNEPESNMTVLDGLTDGFFIIMMLLLFRAYVVPVIL